MRKLRRPLLPVVLVLLLPVGLTAPGCVTNPATGKRVFNTMSVEREIEIGEQAQPKFIESNGGNIPDEQVLSYVRDLGNRLAEVSERPELPWEFHVLDSSQINAFALPGGKVFMSRGLMEKMTNEAQLAGVLGHEIGHVTSMHVGRRMSQAQAVQVGGLILLGAGAASDEDWLKILGVGTTVGGSVYLLSFSRANETEADMLGVRYMSRLGYNPYGQVQVMEILKAESGGRGASGIERMLSTHPLPQDRIDDLRELIAEQYPESDSEGTYRFEQARFESVVLDRLKRLPPPRHDPDAQQKAAALQAYYEHMAGACGDGCDVATPG